jgi:hypothetical protein
VAISQGAIQNSAAENLFACGLLHNWCDASTFSVGNLHGVLTWDFFMHRAEFAHNDSVISCVHSVWYCNPNFSCAISRIFHSDDYCKTKWAQILPPNPQMFVCISTSQSGAVVRSMFEINISAGHLWRRGFDSRSSPFPMW